MASACWFGRMRTGRWEVTRSSKTRSWRILNLPSAMRRAGYRVGLATAFGHLRVRMYHNLAEVVQGLGKHAAAGRRASGWRAFWAVLRMSLTLLAPWLLGVAALNHVVTQPLAWHGGLALVAAVAALALSLGFWAQRYRQWYALPGRMGRWPRWVGLSTCLSWCAARFRCSSDAG
jgi:hypothetical protein